MGYRVRSVGLWLGYGKLHQCSSQATYYSHPSSAEVSAQKYMNRTGLESMELISTSGMASVIKRVKGQTGVCLRVIARLDGSYRVSGGGQVVVSRSLSKAAHKLIDLWIGARK